MREGFFVLLVLCLVGVLQGRQYCSPGEECWPTQEEVQELYDSLEPGATRSYKWAGEGTPKPGPIPIFSKKNQPLYGLGMNNMEPLYSKSLDDEKHGCFSILNSSAFPYSLSYRPFGKQVESNDGYYSSDFCRAATRNNPLNGIDPQWVAWPLTREHVKNCLDFANKHNLAVCVAGTGHDYLNRHNCERGLFIRMALMKNITWDLDDERNPQGGSVTSGPGNVFEELQASAAPFGRYIASGWCSTVGIVGWSIGGGHGPFAPSVGLGVDNILEIEIMTAATEIVTANSTHNTDIFWALKGGGGSTWGVILSITVKGHLNPPYGFTDIKYYWTGTMCEHGPNSVNFLNTLVPYYLDWILPLDTQYSGFAFFVTKKSEEPATCGATWFAWINYLYLGDPTGEEFIKTMSNLTAVGGLFVSNNKTFTNWIDQNLELRIDPIYPVESFPQMDGVSVGAIPSTTVSYENTADGTLANFIIAQMQQCPDVGRCGFNQIYQDITGNVGSPQNPDVSIGPGLRSDFLHFCIDFMSDETEMAKALQLGHGAYFSESAYELEDYRDRYWGGNYKRLQEIKHKIDPTQRFSCRHCVE